MKSLQLLGCWLTCAAICVLLAGCGGGERLVTVEGRVVREGQPIVGEQADEDRTELEVQFKQVDASGTEPTWTYTAPVEADGSFKVDGPMGEGIPEGRYRVGVVHLAEDEETDLLGGKFSVENSPFEFDVPSDEEILIDLAKPPANP